MSATATLLRKEVRALAGLWLLVAGGILLGELQHDFRELEAFFYVIGALALGATSIGHEYRYGTLAQLLTQPVSRARIFAIKFALLGALLLALALLAFLVIFRPLAWHSPGGGLVLPVFVLPVAYGFLVAPWMTLKSRNMLAGTLFSGSIAALLFLAGDRVATLRGLLPGEIDAFRLRTLWTGSCVVCAWAALSLWRSSLTLEAVDGVRSDVALPEALRGTPSTALRRRHPLMLLVGKELRLQQLTFVASGLYVVLYFVLRAEESALFRRDDALVAVSLIHAVVIAALAGALSCAEERVLGTLPWQLLQPVAARVQFAVKLAVTITVTFALAVGLPVLLVSVFGGVSSHWTGSPASVASALALLLAGSIYLSSFAPNAVSAFFLCVPGFMLTIWFAQRVVRTLVFWVFAGLYRLPNGRFVRPFVYEDGGLGTLIVLGVVLLVLVFAFENYRRTERSLPRVARQIVVVSTLVLAIAAAFAAAGRWPVF